jgi:hypothetical protein
MTRTRIMLAAVAIALAAPHGATAQSPASATESPTIPNLPDVDPELLRLVVADQWDRGVDMFGGRQVTQPAAPDFERMAERDAKRRADARRLLAAGRIRSGREHQFAALLFQHSDTAEDLRLAHVLATTAVFKGQIEARWLAAATTDRYLWHLGQPQIFGTQFTRGPGAPEWTNEPYDREALSDSVRAAWCVVPLSEQAAVLAAMRQGKATASTSLADCPH